VVHSCLFTFTVLLALRLDDAITWSYWLVFSPIWLWNFMVAAGATIGSIVWWRNPHFRYACWSRSGLLCSCGVGGSSGYLNWVFSSNYRIEGEAYVQYKAMMITLALHLLLLMFELLVCDNLESRRHIWILVFVPLIFISIISIAICIWAVKNDRSFDVSFANLCRTLQMYLLLV
jgi:hypothetical protein